MRHKPLCCFCDTSMELVRIVPGWTLVPAVECFQCECGEVSIRHAIVRQMSIAEHRGAMIASDRAAPGPMLPGPVLIESPDLQPYLQASA